MIIERMYIEGDIPNKTFTDGRHEIEVATDEDIERIEEEIEAVDALKMDTYDISDTETKTGYTFNGKDVYVRNLTYEDFTDDVCAIDNITVISISGFGVDSSNISYPVDSTFINIRNDEVVSELINVGTIIEYNLFIYYTKGD